MAQETDRDRISRTRIVYPAPGVDAVTMRRDVEYRVTQTGPLTLDLYYPPGSASGDRTPAVVFVTGYSDAGARRMLGCALKDMGSYVSWAQTTAASGIVAVTYTNADPADDPHAVLRYLREHAATLGLDEQRIGVWACSGNVPNALSLLLRDARSAVACAILCYGYTLDLDGSTRVAEAAKQWGFVYPTAGRSVDDVVADVPLFVVRAGRDEMPGLNETLDRFVAGALACNLPLTLVNHAEAPHAFDLFHDTDRSREIIEQSLAFMRFNLIG
jgi:hypothetical protein